MLSASCATRNRQSAASFADDGGQRLEVHREVEPALATAPFAFRAQRLDQAELLQDRRVQLVRQGVDVLAEAHEARADLLHRLCLRLVRGGELGAADVDRQHGEPLAHVVVQLAREQRSLLLMGPDQALAQVVQLVLGALALGDVAEDAVRLDRASGGVARGDAADVLEPLLPLARRQVAILEEEPLQPPVVQLLAHVHHAGAVVGMQMLHPELQGLEPLLPVGGDAAEVAKAVVDVDGACAEVHLVEGEAGELDARLQASLARAKRFLGALALGDVDGDAHQASGSPVDVNWGRPRDATQRTRPSPGGSGTPH